MPYYLIFEIILSVLFKTKGQKTLYNPLTSLLTHAGVNQLERVPG